MKIKPKIERNIRELLHSSDSFLIDCQDVPATINTFSRTIITTAILLFYSEVG